jgi:hypothetical protein
MDAVKNLFVLPNTATPSQIVTYSKNVQLYKEICANFDAIEGETRVEDLYLNFDIDRFINIYPYNPWWLKLKERGA